MNLEKQTIHTVWKDEDCNILIDALAGSGKTTILMELVKFCNHIVLFLAYNKSIQEEITQRLETQNLHQGKAITLHSMGLLAIRNNYKKVNINNNKYFSILKQIQSEHKNLFKMSWEDKMKISFTLLDMNDISRLFLTDNISEINKYALVMDKKLHHHFNLQKIWNIFIEKRTASYELAQFDIDFTDMLYLPIFKDLTIPLYPIYLLIDEAQDLSLLQHKLVEKLISQGSIKKWCCVGDPRQSIYAFSGAFSNSFDLFRKKENVKELSLSTCYRCPKNIIDEANEVFNVMKYGKEEEGIVGNVLLVEDIKDNSMVICRHNSPLLAVYFKLLSLKKSAYIKGDEILTAIIRFLTPIRYLTIHAAEVEINYKLTALKTSTIEEEKIEYYRLRENYAIFKILTENLCAGNKYIVIDVVITQIKALFIDKKNAIMLCSIHKSKGLEADIVYILNEFLIPSQFATSKEQIQQEQHLKYVARTRAKKELYYINYE